LQKKQYVGVPSPNPLIVGKTNSREIISQVESYWLYFIIRMRTKNIQKKKKKVQDEVKGNLHPA
jgi:hypothetical protein